MEATSEQEQENKALIRTHTHRVFNSIKIKKESVVVNYTKLTLTERLDELGNVIGEERNKETIPHELDFIPHPDLLKSLKMLRKTVIQAMEFKDFTDHKQYNVIGISIFGEQDNAKVIITYTKNPKWTDDEATANTVPIPLYDNDDFGDSEKVDKLCSIVKNESFYFVDGIKRGVKEQLELQFEGGDKVKMDVQGANHDSQGGEAEQHQVDLPFGNEPVDTAEKT